MARCDSVLLTRRILVSVFVMAGSVGLGCSRPDDARFTERATLSELPEKHQQQIRDTLAKLFGTAVRPVLAVADDVELTDAETVLRQRTLEHGRQVYRQRCAGCHGVTGDGNGPAAPYLNPKPRDYRRGIFKFTSTQRGAKPLREDLVRIIRRGARGTSMPAFRWLPDEDMQPLVDYVILLSKRGEMEYMLIQEAEAELEEEDDVDEEIVEDLYDRIVRSWNVPRTKIVLPATRMPDMTDETVRLGHQAFLSRGCAKCHGEDGRGQTQANVGKDVWGNFVQAADLTAGMLHGGRRPIDVYRRIYAGINGTPMPAFEHALKDSPDTTWHLAHFILSIVEGNPIPTPPEDQASEQ